MYCVVQQSASNPWKGFVKSFNMGVLVGQFEKVIKSLIGLILGWGQNLSPLKTSIPADIKERILCTLLTQDNYTDDSLVRKQ